MVALPMWSPACLLTACTPSPLLVPAVKDIRLVRDRYSGEPRGVAYIQFFRWGQQLGAVLIMRLFMRPGGRE